MCKDYGRCCDEPSDDTERAGGLETQSRHGTYPGSTGSDLSTASSQYLFHFCQIEGEGPRLDPVRSAGDLARLSVCRRDDRNVRQNRSLHRDNRLQHARIVNNFEPLLSSIFSSTYAGVLSISLAAAKSQLLGRTGVGPVYRGSRVPFVEEQIGEGVKPIENPRTLPFGDPLSRQLNGPPRLMTRLHLVRLRIGADEFSGCAGVVQIQRSADQRVAATPLLA